MFFSCAIRCRARCSLQIVSFLMAEGARAASGVVTGCYTGACLGAMHQLVTRP
jgi:hypothetical protein